jgi:hypothetical protein
MASRLGSAVLALAVVAVTVLLPSVAAQQTLRLQATLTLEKSDDKVKTHDQVVAILKRAKEEKLESNVINFLSQMVGQLQKVLDTAKVVEEMKANEVPKDFTPAKYRVKAMPKLGAKKSTTKKITAMELKKQLKAGKSINFAEPILVTNATPLFEGDTWNNLRRHWSAARISGDEKLEKDFTVEYWPPDKAKARLIGNQLHMEDPQRLTFSKYLVVCFYGSPAKPKLPGQNTDHCEQTVSAAEMVHNASELNALNIFPEITNALPLQADFRDRLLAAGSEELPLILGKAASKWKKQTGQTHHQFLTFGPSGSGDKLHAENGLPMYDFLIHGSRRWLLMKEEEMERVAKKAKEALEFDKTSAYMFFEEKLPELKEEFGLKNYVECNQNAGDLVIVPSGWYRVSLALADSISYYETLLSEQSTLSIVTDNNVWRPQFQRYQLAFCYDAEDLSELSGVDKGSDFEKWLSNALGQVKPDEILSGIMSVLFTCGSVLALDKSMPQFKVDSLSSCTPKVWTKCRKKLQAKLSEKGVKATLDWLPKQAPKSIDDIPKAQKAIADSSSNSEEL